jgi:hypothetical protein
MCSRQWAENTKSTLAFGRGTPYRRSWATKRFDRKMETYSSTLNQRETFVSR